MDIPIQNAHQEATINDDNALPLFGEDGVFGTIPEGLGSLDLMVKAGSLLLRLDGVAPDKATALGLGPFPASTTTILSLSLAEARTTQICRATDDDLTLAMQPYTLNPRYST